MFCFKDSIINQIMSQITTFQMCHYKSEIYEHVLFSVNKRRVLLQCFCMSQPYTEESDTILADFGL